MNQPAPPGCRRQPRQGLAGGPRICFGKRAGGGVSRFLWGRVGRSAGFGKKLRFLQHPQHRVFRRSRAPIRGGADLGGPAGGGRGGGESDRELTPGRGRGRGEVPPEVLASVNGIAPRGLPSTPGCFRPPRLGTHPGSSRARHTPFHHRRAFAGSNPGFPPGAECFGSAPESPAGPALGATPSRSCTPLLPVPRPGNLRELASPPGLSHALWFPGGWVPRSLAGNRAFPAWCFSVRLRFGPPRLARPGAGGAGLEVRPTGSNHGPQDSAGLQ